MHKPLLAGITALAVGATTVVAIASPAAAAAAARQVVYATDPDDGYLVVLDANTYEFLTYLDGVGAKPTGVTVSPDGARAYIAGLSGSTVAVVDTATSTTTANVEVGPGPMSIAVSPDGARVYVTSTTKLSVIDARTNAVVAAVQVGSQPADVAVSPDGRRAYVADESGASVKVVDTASNTVTATVSVPGQPQHVAVTPDGRRVYVANSAGTGSVSAIDTATNTVTATIPTNDGARDIAITPDGTRAYVPGDRAVRVISTATNTVTATVAGFVAPKSVAITPDGTRAIVTNNDHNLVVIDTATNTAKATEGDLGFNPVGLAIATVHPAPPTASLVLTPQPESNRVFWDASGSKHGFGSSLSRSIDWGDGNTGVDAPNFHDYAHGGTYTVTLTVTDELGAKATTSQQITLQSVTRWFAMLSASNLRYVSAEGAGAQPLVGDRTTAGPWETLAQIDVGGGVVVFRATVNGKYLTVDAAGKLTANAAAVADASRFKIVTGGNGLFSLLSVSNNRYVSGNNGSGPLTADRAAIGPWEQFYATRSTYRQFISLSNYRYVTAENGGNSPLIANRDAPGLWESFDEIEAGDGYIALFSHANQRFVVAENGGNAPLVANRTAVGPWEKFSVEPGWNGSAMLRAGANNRYVTAENGGRSALIANRTAAGSWEQFTGL
ncbi:cytochrome D1 domain-containing protein [Dactylosporangium sp. CA-139114]|uniref:cytochrome D1 domain-containing protein n=1 Tax=Dactylosporangium sp. CA-139114 TaxID=3239931 RepID=UPI003D95A654